VRWRELHWAVSAGHNKDRQRAAGFSNQLDDGVYRFHFWFVDRLTLKTRHDGTLGRSFSVSVHADCRKKRPGGDR